MPAATTPSRDAGHAKRGWREFSGLPSVFWRLAFAMCFRGLGAFVLSFLPYYLAVVRHLSAGQIAMVIAVFGAGWAVGDPVGGYLADRLSRRNLIVVSNLALAAAYVGLGYARDISSLVAATAAVALVFDVWRPAAQALLAEATVTPEQRKQAMTLLFWAMNATSGVACVAAGFLAITAGWKWLFLGSAIAAAAFAAVTLLVVPGASSNAGRPQSPAPSTAAARGASGRSRRVPSRVPRVDWLLAAFTFLTLVYFTIYSQTEYGLPVRFAGDGIAPVGYGLIMAVNPLTVGVLQLVVQRWIGGGTPNGRRPSRTLPALWSCTIGIAVTGIGVAVTGGGSGLAWFLITSEIVTLGEIFFYGPAQAFVADFAPPDRVASYLGIWGATGGLSTLSAAAAGGAIVDAGGLPLLWELCAVTGVAAACACALLAPWTARRRDGTRPAGAAAAAASPAAAAQDSGSGRQHVPARTEGGAS